MQSPAHFQNIFKVGICLLKFSNILPFLALLWHFLAFFLKNCIHGLTFYRIGLVCSFEKKLLKLLKITKLVQLVQKWGPHEPHSKQKNNFFSEITKPNHKLPKIFYFIKIYVLAELSMFFYFVCFFAKKCHFQPNSWVWEKKLTLHGPFSWMGFNCLKATATLRRQFAFYH